MGKSKYDAICSIILHYLASKSRANYSQITEEVRRLLTGRFEGCVGWYSILVKLDMEGRGEIVREREKGGDWMTLLEN